MEPRQLRPLRFAPPAETFILACAMPRRALARVVRPKISKDLPVGASPAKVGDNDHEPLDDAQRFQAKMCDLSKKVPMPKKMSNDQVYQQTLLQRQSLANVIDLLWKHPERTFETHAWLMSQLYHTTEQDDELWDASYTLWSRAPHVTSGSGSIDLSGAAVRAPNRRFRQTPGKIATCRLAGVRCAFSEFGYFPGIR